MFAGWLVHNTAFQVILILVLSLWFFGWVGTLFLSSTRVIFAGRVRPGAPRPGGRGLGEAEGSGLLAAPDAAARGGADARIYAYSTTFRTYTLDATLVIAVTYLFSAIAVVHPAVASSRTCGARRLPARSSCSAVPDRPGRRGGSPSRLLGFCLDRVVVNDN